MNPYNIVTLVKDKINVRLKKIKVKDWNKWILILWTLNTNYWNFKTITAISTVSALHPKIVDA